MDSQRIKPIIFSSSDQINDIGWHDLSRIEARTVHIWGLIQDGTPATIALCRQWLSVEEQARAGRFVHPDDGNRYILGRGCLRALLARYIGLAPSALVFQLGAMGKPVLAVMPDGGDRLHFNVSHSHGRMLIAVARQQEVGVDLEWIRGDVEVVKLAQRFYAPSEQEGVTGLPGPAQAAQFFRYWAAKEAFLKCKGVGLQFPLDRCEITLSPDGPTASVSWTSASGPVEPGLIQFLPLEDGWVGAVAATGDGWKTEVCRWP